LLDVAEPGISPPDWVALYERALAAYRGRDFAGAANFLEQVLVARSSDQPARILLKRCQEFLKSPPGEDWDATNAMKSK